MKTLPPRLLSLLLALAAPALAAPRDLATPDRKTRVSHPAPPAEVPQWNVRVEVLMVALPEEKMLALLPSLNDPQKIEAATAQLLAAVQSKEALLLGYPMVVTKSGQRAVTESIEEVRYPTEFNIPVDPRPAKEPVAPVEKADDTSALPTDFETRNAGVTLEVEPTMSSDGEWVNVNLVPQLVTLQGFRTFARSVTKSGAILTIDQPQFVTSRITTSVSVRNGQRLLLGVQTIPKPEHYLGVAILQATATAIK